MPISGGSAIAPQDVWDILVASQTGVGSLGKLVKDNLDMILSSALPVPGVGGVGVVTASDDELEGIDTELPVTDAAYAKRKEYTITVPGRVRLTWMYKMDGTADTIYSRTYLNGGAVGDQRTTQSGSYQQAPDEEIDVVVTDTVELWAFVQGTGTGYIKDFKIKGVITPAVGIITKDS